MIPKRIISIIASLAIFCLILFLCAKYYSRSLALINEVDIKWFLGGIICYYCNYLCRAYRVWIYANKQGRFFPTFVKISGLHGFNSYFLPMRGGDLTLPLLLLLHADIPLIQGGKVLIRARLMDLYLLGFLLLAGTLFTETSLSYYWKILFWIVGLSFIILPYVLTGLLRRPGKWSKEKVKKLVGTVPPAYPGIHESMLSLLIWFWTGSTIFCVIKSLDIPIAFLDVWFLATIQLPLQLLPVQGVANAGNHEAGWVAGLSLLGIDPEQGLVLALSSHLLVISYVVFLGAVSFVMPLGRSRQ